jgi:hypothetical protein
MAIIPPTNLPVYLQRYTVAISDGSVSWALLSANPSNLSLNRVWSFQLNGTLSHTTRETYTIEYNLDNVEDGGYLISFEGTAVGSIILSNSSFVVNEKNLSFTYVDTPIQKRIVLQLDAKICPVKEGRTRPFLLDFYLNDTATTCPDFFSTSTTPTPFFITFSQDTNPPNSYYEYTAPASGSTQGTLTIASGFDVCQFYFSVNGMANGDTLLVINNSSPSSVFLPINIGTPPTPTSTSTPTYYASNANSSTQSTYFQSPYGLTLALIFLQQMLLFTYAGATIIPTGSIEIYTATANSILFQATLNEPISFVVAFAVASSISDSIPLTNIQYLVFQYTASGSFMTAVFDNSLVNSVMCSISSASQNSCYQVPIALTPNTTGTEWTWSSSQIVPSSFTALLQDPTTLNYVIGTNSCTTESQPGFQSEVNTMAIWTFVEANGVYIIYSGTTTSTSGCILSSYCTSSAPCITTSTIITPWTLSTVPSTPMNTNPFSSTLLSTYDSQYLSVSSSVKLQMSTASYTWTIIPVVLGSSTTCP